MRRKYCKFLTWIILFHLFFFIKAIFPVTFVSHSQHTVLLVQINFWKGTLTSFSHLSIVEVSNCLPKATLLAKMFSFQLSNILMHEFYPSSSNWQSPQISTKTADKNRAGQGWWWNTSNWHYFEHLTLKVLLYLKKSLVSPNQLQRRSTCYKPYMAEWRYWDKPNTASCLSLLINLGRNDTPFFPALKIVKNFWNSIYSNWLKKIENKAMYL